MITTPEYINHVRNRTYMSGIDRDKLRIKQTAEIFTPKELVLEMIDKLEEQDSSLFSDPTKTFIDNSCGDGEFLGEIVIRKMERSKCSLEEALSTTYGVDLMEDNVEECKKRLMGPNPTDELRKIVDRNIVCHDGLTYDYEFNIPVNN
jgi:hypothetical protein